MNSEQMWDTGDVAKYLKKFRKNGDPNRQAINVLLWKDPTFPRPYKIGSRTNLFDPAEIHAWVRSRPRSKVELHGGKRSGRGRPAKAAVNQ